jgi:predicted transcriptional regulator
MNTIEYKAIMPKTVTLRLDDATYAFFRDCAQADNRTLSNMIETAAKRQLESKYIGPEEEREILRDAPLMRRIRAGARDAKARRGRMIG